MNTHDWILGIGAFAASVILHGTLLLNTGSLAGNDDQVRPERSATRVSFRSLASPQIPPQTMPEKPPEPEAPEAPEPPPKPETPKPEKRVEKARQQTTTPPAQTHTAPPTPATAESVTGTVEDPALIERARQEYLRHLMAHIESHKHYPQAARRRGIQGDVAVSFSLHADGHISGHSSQGSHRLLLAAADDAIQTAQPMPSPPDSLPLPWDISFTMRFTLK